MPRPADDYSGARIADFRKPRQLTQAGLAQRAFPSPGTIAKVEAGLTPGHANHRAARVAQAHRRARRTEVIMAAAAVATDGTRVDTGVIERLAEALPGYEPPPPAASSQHWPAQPPLPARSGRIP
ncbi:helix-turn-helix domain-containing protein [Streptomyces sp. NBC_01803]|uniref:helix-turn-helix domain-containing protein n=1 Tax=Streptomyces sp. NBC_01803 TaxID=2975946 RepID=UPI002DDB4D48|nr:helix-turn-helix domain-containing protein [Streptomyces sp. NBC_01803]WSA45985.1 helix-turn-helix domain-containing protein [Streptomyces sp. NBC_01803]